MVVYSPNKSQVILEYSVFFLDRLCHCSMKEKNSNSQGRIYIYREE